MSRPITPGKNVNNTINNISNIIPQLKAIITNHHIEEDFVIYTIKIFDEQSNETWNFDSRFSEFYQLNNAIINSKKIPISDLPKFPKKKHLWSNNKDPQLIIKRRTKLERFLNHILSNDKIKALECVQNFIKRSKREFQIFQNFTANPKTTVNLAKNIEKGFLDEIDSSMSNSDFLEIMEKYEEYEQNKDHPQRRTASKFINNYKREKTGEFEIKEDLVLKLEKVDVFDEKNPDFIENLNSENSKTMDNMNIKESLTPIKTIKRNNSLEKVKVVYMSPILKIERSGSIKKQEMLKKMENKYPAKKSFMHSYFGGLCGSCSD